LKTEELNNGFMFYFVHMTTATVNRYKEILFTL